MPIWSFGRGVLGFFEGPAVTRGVVSLVKREFEASILLVSLGSPKMRDEANRLKLVNCIYDSAVNFTII